jgi:hypothetical protein
MLVLQNTTRGDSFQAPRPLFVWNGSCREGGTSGHCESRRSRSAVSAATRFLSSSSSSAWGSRESSLPARDRLPPPRVPGRLAPLSPRRASGPSRARPAARRLSSLRGRKGASSDVSRSSAEARPPVTGRPCSRSSAAEEPPSPNSGRPSVAFAVTVGRALRRSTRRAGAPLHPVHAREPDRGRDPSQACSRQRASVPRVPGRREPPVLHAWKGRSLPHPPANRDPPGERRPPGGPRETSVLGPPYDRPLGGPRPRRLQAKK